MKLKLLLISCFLLSLFAGCIQDEPLSPYADINSFALPDDVTLSDATINQNEISIYVRKGVDLTALVPSITISEGATISPDSTVARDFSQPVTYTVTAPDGVHQRTYTIQTISLSLYNYRFENWEALTSGLLYETPVEYDLKGQRTTPWDSSNKGIAIYQQYPSAEEYTIHKTKNAAEGTYAAEMITKEGPGDIFGIMYIPIVAGSLFTGVLNPLNAMKDPLLATQFGQPFYDKPVSISGKYFYRAGRGDYIDPSGKPLPGIKDSCAVYSVFYRTDESLNRLDGTNVLTHPNIVALAMLPPEGRAASPGEGFADFDIPFVYTSNHVVDFDKYQYKLAIVFSSSFYGDRYEGTPGSRLIVDDIEIKIEEEDPS